jgi:hypothetical protein
MNRTRVLTIVALFFLLATMAQGYAYVRSTMEMYKHGAPCGQQLQGVPRLLEIAHFIPPSACRTVSDGSCHDNSVCTQAQPPSGTGGNGHCTTVKTGSTKTCVCK